MDFSFSLGAVMRDVAEGEPDSNRGQQFDIVSRVAYLIGVPKRIFDNEQHPMKIEIYNQLDLQKKARIIRNLCIVRNQLEHNFLKICYGIQREGRSILGMPEFIPTDVLQALADDGIDIYKNLKEPSPFLFNINLNIKNRINNCKDLFPDWLEWDYLSDIFIMPNGTTEAGTKAAAEKFYENMANYPYGMYINCPGEDEGNILFNDKRFVTLLYKWHNDQFTELSYVSDVSERTKANIYTFIENSKKCVFIVDCENSDPYNLCAAIRNMDKDKLSKIDKIILFDDVHAASAWELLASYIDINVEYIMIERLKDKKSLADVKVAARTCKEFYSNDVDSFVLVSSDSDYWGLIEELPEAKFLVMVEHDKCSYALKETLINNDIFYCYIDDFYVGGGEEIKNAAIQKELTRCVDEALELNLNKLMNEVLAHTRIDMSYDEVQGFIKKNLKNRLSLNIAENGDVKLVYKVK